jgi:hypothetical protein
MQHSLAFLLRLCLFAALLFSVHCGSDTGTHPSSSAIDASAIDASAIDASAIDGNLCSTVVQGQANGGHLHTANDCDPVTYPTNPPSSGTHYPDWAMYKTYTSPVPWGFLVHDLEHGAIVILYNCPGGCADEVAQAQALIDGLARDKNCGAAPMKIVLAPAPDLTARWAAAAWTWTLRADCFDRQAFASFIGAHYEGPDTEAACGGGLDRSVSGWCP